MLTPITIGNTLIYIIIQFSLLLYIVYFSITLHIGRHVHLVYGGSSRVSASVDNVDPSGHKGGKDETVPLLGGITKAALNSRVW